MQFRSEIASFTPLGLVSGGIQLLCSNEGHLSDTLQAFVEGILIGQISVDCSFSTGDVIEIPVKRFPLVALPCRLRYKSEVGALPSEGESNICKRSDVYLLVGPGEITMDGYVIEAGSLNLTMSNATNGCWLPQIYARFETGITRNFTVESIRLRDEGGCSAKLRLPLLSEDLHAGGLRIEVSSADREGVFDVIEFRQASVDGLAEQLSRYTSNQESRQANLVIRVNAIERALTRRAEALEQRVDAFFEYLLGIVLDNAARLGHTDGGQARDANDVGQRWRSFVDEIAPQRTSHATSGETTAPGAWNIDLTTSNFMDGWNGIEFDANGNPFRWMTRKGYLSIPASESDIDLILVTTGAFYKDLTCPIGATINGRKAHVQMMQLSFSGEHELSISLPPQPLSSGKSMSVLTLESETWGVPADELMSDDDRELSVMVREVRFLRK